MPMKNFNKKIASQLETLSPRERVIVGISALALLITLAYFAISYSLESTRIKAAKKTVRQGDLAEIHYLLKQHSQLEKKLSAVEEAFSNAEMSFEQITSEVDKFVKQSLGSDVKYDFKRKGQNATSLGDEFEKMTYILSLNSITLDQTVKFLYNFEQGKSSLTMGKVNMRRNSSQDSFQTTFDIFSVRRKEG